MDAKIIWRAAVAALALFAAAAVAQVTTVNVPVTFYDFRSNRSNPEFEQPHQGGHRTGMVAEELDADGKPRVGPTPYRNYGVAHWFRDWNAYTGSGQNFFGKGSNFAPVYDPTPGIQETHNPEFGASVSYLGVQDVGHDTSFKNIVIKQELPFTLNSRGLYEFSRRGSTQFRPLDGLGFGNEWTSASSSSSSRNRNYAFTMEMVYPFEAVRGMRFEFQGDDDVWVFINRRLALDIGGIHGPVDGSFVIDDVIPSSRFGTLCTLYVFYAERHTNDANIHIETNIVSPPGRLELLEVTSSGSSRPITGTLTKDADDTVKVTTNIYDKGGNVIPRDQINCANVTWKIDNKEVHRGCTLTVDNSIAGTINIEAVYTGQDGKDDPVRSHTSMQIYPIEPACVYIQSSSKPKEMKGEYKGCGDPALSDDIFFTPDVGSVTAYAILRDKYGNAVEWGSGGVYRSSSANWQSDNHDVAVTDPSRGASVSVVKQAQGEGSEGRLIVSFQYTDAAGRSRGPFADTVAVGSKREPGGAVGPNPFVPGVSNIRDYYKGTNVPEFYDNVVKNSGKGSGSGVLIAIDAPKQLQVFPGGKQGAAGAQPYAKVVIFDAVGNLVHADYAYRAKYASSYGYVWDGTNVKGRKVGPGTYLARITGKDGDGNNFAIQRKIGVTK